MTTMRLPADESLLQSQGLVLRARVAALDEQLEGQDKQIQGGRDERKGLRAEVKSLRMEVDLYGAAIERILTENQQLRREKLILQERLDAALTELAERTHAVSP